MILDPLTCRNLGVRAFLGIDEVASRGQFLIGVDESQRWRLQLSRRVSCVHNASVSKYDKKT